MPSTIASPACTPAMLVGAAPVPKAVGDDECDARTRQQRDRNAGDDEGEVELEGLGMTFRKAGASVFDY